MTTGCAMASDAENDSTIAERQVMAYGRFVPERQDDFAWENDKVAFRVYGPSSKGKGTVSGVDPWFKKVDYSIIDKWYKEHAEGQSYHEDNGEGHDIYHVGPSRGVGGTAIWIDGTAYPAAMYKSYEIHQSGGDVVKFTVEYEWETPLGTVAERKKISLELGSQLYQVDSSFTLDGEPASLPIAIGLATHDEAAAVYHDAAAGRISTWEIMQDYGVGTGVLLASERVDEILHAPSDEKDASHIWLLTTTTDSGQLSYRAGFAWEAAGEIRSIEQWNAYLDSEAADLFRRRNANALDPATIDAVGDKVADWQLAHLDELNYMRNVKRSTLDRRGWVHGALFVGMMNWAAAPGNERHYEPLRKISEEEDWRLGDRIFHADDHIVGQLYLDFYEREQEPEMIDDTIRRFNQILAADPRASLEFLGQGMPGVGRACQVRWCWCDALFMAPPTFVKLSQLTGDDRYTAFADKEFWATTEYLKDPELNLYYRDSRYFDRREESGNKIFWSRGNGWVYAGIVNILRILPTDHPSYPRYVQLYKDMSIALAGLQGEDGFWSPSLLDTSPDRKPESSGTGFMTYGLAWGVNNGHLDAAEYGPVVNKGWRALVSAVGDDGKLGWVQPIGSSPDSVFETDSQLYGVGALLLAAAQMLEYK